MLRKLIKKQCLCFRGNSELWGKLQDGGEAECVRPAHRTWLIMPFMHSEQLADQQVMPNGLQFHVCLSCSASGWLPSMWTCMDLLYACIPAYLLTKWHTIFAGLRA